MELFGGTEGALKLEGESAGAAGAGSKESRVLLALASGGEDHGHVCGHACGHGSNSGSWRAQSEASERARRAPACGGVERGEGSDSIVRRTPERPAGDREVDGVTVVSGRAKGSGMGWENT